MREELEKELAEFAEKHCELPLTEQVQKLISHCVDLIATDCADLADAHGQQMDRYGYGHKSKTAFACAGIIREHFGVKGK